MKKALVLASTFPRWKNDSTPSFVYDLCRQMSKKYKIHVLAPHSHTAKTHEIEGNVEISRYRYFQEKNQKIAYGAGIIPNIKKSLAAKIQIPGFLALQYLCASRIIRKQSPDLIHAHWMIPQGVIGAYLKKKFKIPLITTIHGSDLFPIKNRFLVRLQKYAVENSDAITVNTQSAFDELMSRFPQAKKKTHIIPMGIDTFVFRRRINFAHSRTKTKKQKTAQILFVGRLNEQKGIETLIQAIPIVQKKIPSSKLIIVGEGEHKSHLIEIARQNSVEKSIEFKGAVAKKNLPEIYSSSDVFVLPSITSKIGTEAMGIVLLEAMACATPVIGSSSGGIKDVITDEKNGLIFEEKNHEDLAAKIIRLLSDRKLSRRLSFSGLKHSKNFSWEKISVKFEKLYGEILK